MDLNVLSRLLSQRNFVVSSKSLRRPHKYVSFKTRNGVTGAVTEQSGSLKPENSTGNSTESSRIIMNCFDGQQYGCRNRIPFPVKTSHGDPFLRSWKLVTERPNLEN